MIDSFKSAIRKTCCDVRKKLPRDFQQKASVKICAQIKQLNQYRYARKIALYHACKGEVTLDQLWHSAPMQGKFCYFPALNSEKTLSFLPATPVTPFKTNCYDIPEPDVAISEALPPRDLDIIFMPLVAFDEFGTRMGMGGGYYDRTLAQENHPLLIGVAYECQRQPYIAPQEWDIPLTAIITEQTIWWSKSLQPFQ